MTNATNGDMPMEDYSRYERVWNRIVPYINGVIGEGEALAPSAAVAAQMPPKEEGTGCCLARSAMVYTDTIGGYIADELSDSVFYSAFSRCAPSREGRELMQKLSREEKEHSRKLMAAYYMITGKIFSPVTCNPAALPSWREGLRLRYNAETCGGLAYMRTAEETEDTCLAELMHTLSADEYRHARQILDCMAKMF